MEANRAMQKMAMTMTTTLQSKLRSGGEFNPVEIRLWWIYGGISILLVCFAGIMSGLTLGLMSLSPLDLKVLQTSGTDVEKKQAAAISPLVTKQHQLLVTLLLCNAVAMEALPIFLDKMFYEWMTVVLSVTLVLAFGEVIPQAICSRYGLAVGANMVWLVNLLMLLCWPIAYPIALVLDFLLGHDNSALFRRAQLKALVSIHGKEAGGYLTHDETTIINGALDLTEKTAAEAMTPIESTFSLDINSKLDRQTLDGIVERGHSRVPIYSGSPQNIVGLLLVKNLLKVRAEEKSPLSAVSIRRIPRVPEDMPLYDILNEFQKGGSHMAAVVGVKKKTRKVSPSDSFGHKEDRKRVKDYQDFGDSDIERDNEKPCCNNGDRNTEYEQFKGEADHKNQEDVEKHINKLDIENGNVIGIITMEDVMEELLQKEIVDETDEYINVHKRIRVVAAAQMSSKNTSVPQPKPSPAPVPNIGMIFSKQTQETIHISIDAIQSYIHKDNKYPKMDKAGLTQPLLGYCPLEEKASKFTSSVTIGSRIFSGVVTV